jgi:N-acyl-D-aspartate/D-glutamate deacylase
VRKQIRRDFETGLPGWENKATVLGWDNTVISSVATAKNRDLAGLSVRAAAQLRGKDDLECLFDLLIEERGQVGRRSIQCCEEDVLAILTHERTMIGSDGLDVENPHPRQYGCFARVLGEYVREKRALALETAVHKMTGLSASTFGFSNLGVLKPGMRADVVVFDADAIRDEGTYADPTRHPTGIEWVFVGGKAAVAEREPTGVRNGQVLRHR